MLATRELANIKIGKNVKRLSVAKDNHSPLLNDEMAIYHVKTSAMNKIHGKKLQVLKIDNYVDNPKNVITVRAPELRVLIFNSDSSNEFSLD